MSNVRRYLQSLYISGEARDTQQTEIICFEDTLEVSINSHKLSCQSSISSNGYAVFARHCDNRVTIIRVLSKKVPLVQFLVKLTIVE